MMISEGHSESDEISFANTNGHRESVNLRILGILITYCVCDFLFYGYSCMKKKTCYSAGKIWHSIRDIPI